MWLNVHKLYNTRFQDIIDITGWQVTFRPSVERVISWMYLALLYSDIGVYGFVWVGVVWVWFLSLSIFSNYLHR